MQSIRKRQAKHIKILRYIREYQVYEVSILWVSEKPMPPTIGYMPDIFLNPYERITQILPCDPSKSLKNQQTNQQASQSLSKISQKAFEKKMRCNNYSGQIESFKNNPKKANKLLNYDSLMTRNCMIAVAIKRNKSVVKQSTYKDILRKKKKTI